MTNWLQETFSSKTTEDDIIKSRSLNITRIAGVVVPAVTAIGTAIAELAKVSPWNDPDFQQRLFLVLLAYVAVVTVADIFGRAIAAAAAARAATSAASLLPVPLPAMREVPADPDIAGRVVAFHTRNLESSSTDSEYLFVSSDGKTVEWVSASDIHAE